MYADELTGSMGKKQFQETNRRRKLQSRNTIREHGITPQTIKKSVRDTIKASIVEDIQSEYNIKEEEDIKGPNRKINK